MGLLDKAKDTMDNRKDDVKELEEKLRREREEKKMNDKKNS